MPGRRGPVTYLAMIVCCGLIIVGCSSGYILQQSDGVETLLRVSKNGEQTIVYIVHRDGSLTLHDPGDPMAKRYMASRLRQSQVDAYLAQLQANNSETPPQQEEDQHLRRIARIQKARKRSASDPIFVTIHDPVLCPEMINNVQNAQTAQERIRRFVSDQIDADETIRVTSHMADVSIFAESYFKETLAFNSYSRRMVTFNAFHFKIAVQSNYLPGDQYTIVEAGNWFENEQIIKRATKRVNHIIKSRIGPTIPAERYKYL